GTALLQLGVVDNLKMIGTASGAKQEIVKQLGGTPINYQTEDFVARVHELTSEGVDSAYDPIGGENFERSYASLRPGGILVTYGNYNVSQGGTSHLELAKDNQARREALTSRNEGGRRISGYFIAAMKREHPDWFREDMAALLDLLAAHKVKP